MNKGSQSRIERRSTRGVAKIDTAVDLDRSRVNWDDLRIFVHVAEVGSLRGSAVRLNVQASTIGRRLTILEDALGGALLVRSPDGIHLTELGGAVYAQLSSLATAVADIERNARSVGPEMFGRVRLSLTEGLGTYWLIPRLIEFQQTHPMLIIDAKCTMEISKTLSIETDLSLQYQEPKGADLHVMRLGSLHIVPFVSQAYAERFGIPKSMAELAQHKIITQATNQVDENTYLQRMGITQPEGVISFRTNSSAAHYALLKKGAGIGVLPSYAACFDRSLIPVELDGVQHKLEVWLAFHPQVKNIPRIAAVINFVRSCFDKNRFPWFRDEYVPAAELAKLPSDDWMANVIDFN